MDWSFIILSLMPTVVRTEFLLLSHEASNPFVGKSSTHRNVINKSKSIGDYWFQNSNGMWTKEKPDLRNLSVFCCIGVVLTNVGKLQPRS